MLLIEWDIARYQNEAKRHDQRYLLKTNNDIYEAFLVLVYLLHIKTPQESASTHISSRVCLEIAILKVIIYIYIESGDSTATIETVHFSFITGRSYPCTIEGN